MFFGFPSRTVHVSIDICSTLPFFSLTVLSIKKLVWRSVPFGKSHENNSLRRKPHHHPILGGETHHPWGGSFLYSFIDGGGGQRMHLFEDLKIAKKVLSS